MYIYLCLLCTRLTSHCERNIRAYVAGVSPVGFPGWPHKKVHLMENVIVNNILQKVDQIQRAYFHQYENPVSDGSESEGDQDVPTIDKEPYEGVSSSDSD